MNTEKDKGNGITKEQKDGHTATRPHGAGPGAPRYKMVIRPWIRLRMPRDLFKGNEEEGKETKGARSTPKEADIFAHLSYLCHPRQPTACACIGASVCWFREEVAGMETQ